MSDVDVIIKVHTQGVSEIGNLSSSLRNLSTTLRGINVPMAKLDVQSRAVNKALGVTSRGVDEHAKSIKGLVQNQKVLGAESRRIAQDLKGLQNAYALAGRETTTLGRSIGYTTKEFKEFSRTFRGLRLRAVGSDISNISLRLTKLGKDAQFVGRSLMINLTLPLATFGRLGLQNLVKIERQMTRLVKVMEGLAPTMEVARQKVLGVDEANKQLLDPAQQASARQMVRSYQEMDRAITDLSLKFAVSKDLVASLAADFAELGLTSEQNVTKITQLSLEIEKLGTMDIGPSQDLAQALFFQSKRALENSGALAKLTSARAREERAISSSITQMQLFNAIENVTALTLEDLGRAFPEVGSMATSFGLSMTEAAALLAPMKAAGLDVGASANSIKVSLQRALAPTKQNADMLARLAKKYGVASDKQNEFALSTKSGIVGLEAIVKVFGRVFESRAGMEGALKLMSDMFEKRQGPRMYLAIEQLHAFNKELAKTEYHMGQLPSRSQTAEVQLARVAEEAVKGFSDFNTTIVPKTIRSFSDISKVARIATAYAGQKIEFEAGKETTISAKDIENAKEVRKQVSAYILELKQSKGIDIISEVKSEAGRALMVQLAGSANAAAVAQSELDRSLATTGVAIEKIKNAFKLFAADIIGKLAPAIGRLADRVVELYNKWTGPEFAKTREAITRLILSVGSFLAVMGPIILAFGTFNSVVGKLGLGLARFFPKLKNAENGFVGLGRTAKVASASINNLYESFVDLARARTPTSLPGVPTASPISPLKLPKTVDARTKQSLLNRALREELTTAGLTPAQIRQARSEFGFGTRATRAAPGTSVRGRGGRMLSRNVTEGLRLLEARELADVVPGPTGTLRSPSTGRLVSGTGPVAAARGRILAPALRQQNIFDRSGFFEQKGISTDRMGTRFVRGGREITESQANRIARGGITGIRARIGVAADAGRAAVRSGVTATRGVLSTARTAATTAMAAAPSARVDRLDTLFKGIKAGTGSLMSHTKAWKVASAAKQAYIAKTTLLGGVPTRIGGIRAALMGMVKGLKIATFFTNLFKKALLFSGIGVILLGVAALVFLVVKNMDKIRGATKGMQALKDAFNIIKSAIGEIIRPIQDMLAAFSNGSDEADAAGNAIASAFTGIAIVLKFVAQLVKKFVVNVIQPYMYMIINIVMAVINIFTGNWGEAFNFLLAAVSQAIKFIIQIWGSLAKGMVTLIFLAVKGILSLFTLIPKAAAKAFGFLSKVPGLGFFKSLSNGINNVVDSMFKAADGAKGLSFKVIDGITGGLVKGVDKGIGKGIKQSKNTIKTSKQPKKQAEESGREAGEAMGNSFGDGFDETDAGGKAGNSIKEGLMDAIQQLQDYVAGRLASALKKFISDSVRALNKQKESALKVFDIQINTLMKLEKAEESLTKKKQYETTRRKLIDDAALRQDSYRRDRALAIYEGRIDDARILDLEERSAQGDTETEIRGVDEDRRKDLAKENLDALRTAIGEAKDLASKFFDESVNKFQEAAEHITRIAPVTIEDYTAQLEQLKTLTTTYADNNNAEFGAMFQKFSTAIAEKMPNTVDDFGKALGAFAGPLDELVNLAMSKYGLGSADEATVLGVTQQMSDAVVGLTLGMLVDIGDTFATSAPAVVEKYGSITGGISGETGLFKDNVIGIFKTLVEETKTAFLTPFQVALDEAEPTKVFNDAIIDGNQEILNSFRNMVDLNPELMRKLAASLDPAIKKYIQLKAAIEAAADAASGGGGGGGGGGLDLSNLSGLDAETRRFNRMRDDFRLANPQSVLLRTASGGGTGMGYRPVTGPSGFGKYLYDQFGPPKALERKKGGPILPSSQPLSPYGLTGFLNAPTSQEIPAILHGGEFIVNAHAVQRIGLGALAKLNDPRIPKFKKGGLVGATAEERRQMAMKPKAKTLGYTADRMEKMVGNTRKGMTADRAEAKAIQDRKIADSYLKAFSTPTKDTRGFGTKVLDAVSNIGAQGGLIDRLTKTAITRPDKFITTPLKLAGNLAYDTLESMSATFTNPLVNMAGRAIGRNPNLREAGLMESALNTISTAVDIATFGMATATGGTAALRMTAGASKSGRFATSLRNLTSGTKPAQGIQGLKTLLSKNRIPKEIMPAALRGEIMNTADVALKQEFSRMPELTRGSGTAIGQLMPGTAKPPLALPMPRTSVPFISGSTDPYVIHGGPSIDNLLGGVISPEFARGGAAYDVIAKLGLMPGKMGRDRVTWGAGAGRGTVFGGGNATHVDNLLATYRHATMILENQSKFNASRIIGAKEYLDFYDNYFYSGAYSGASTNPLSLFAGGIGFDKDSLFHWGNLIEGAKKWVSQNSDMIRHIQQFRTHSTGVVPNFMSDRAYEFGGMHLLKVDKRLRPPNLGPFGEVPFFGTHRPIESVGASGYSIAKDGLEQMKHFEFGDREQSYFKLLDAMINDINANLTPTELLQYLDSARIYGNTITPGARGALLDSINHNMQGTLGNPFNIDKANILDLFSKAKNKKELLDIVDNLRNNLKLETFDSMFKQYGKKTTKENIIEMVEKQNQSAMLGYDAWRFKVNRIIDHIGDAGKYSLDDIKLTTVPEGLGIDEFLKGIPEQHHQIFRDIFEGKSVHDGRYALPSGRLPMNEWPNIVESRPIDEMLNLISGAKDSITNKLDPIPSVPVPEKVFDPALEARRAAALQMRGMGGSGAAFNNIFDMFPLSPKKTEDLFKNLKKLSGGKRSLRETNRFTTKNFAREKYIEKLITQYTGLGNKIMNMRLLSMDESSLAAFAYIKKLLATNYDLESKDFSLITPSLKSERLSIFNAFQPNKAQRKILDQTVQNFMQIVEHKGLITPEDMVIYRGLGIYGREDDIGDISLSYFNKLYKIGKMTSPHFMSTSINKNVAEAFVSSRSSIPVLEELFVPKGTNVLIPEAYGLGLSTEKEIIIPPKYSALIESINLDEKTLITKVRASIVENNKKLFATALGATSLFASKEASATTADQYERNTQSFYDTLRSLSEFIAGGESLNALDPYSAWAKPGATGMIMQGMTSMNLGEVIEAAQGRAVGKYQNMPKFLKSRAEVAGFNINTIFSPEMQEQLMISTLMSLPQKNGLGLISYLTGKVGQDTMVNRIANMWRSISGVGGMYVGVGRNPKGFDPSRKDLKVRSYLDILKATYPGYKMGGYVPGSPSTAIPAILHGGEYVINAKAAQQLGMSYLSAMNAATGSRFRAPSSRIGGANAPVTQSVSNITIQVENFIGEEEWFKSMMKSYNVNVAPKNRKLAGVESRTFTSYNGINQGM